MTMKQMRENLLGSMTLKEFYKATEGMPEDTTIYIRDSYNDEFFDIELECIECDELENYITLW